MPSPIFWKELNQIINEHNGRNRRGNHASFETQAKRREVIHAAFRTLSRLGWCPKTCRNFRNKHMEKLGHYWEEQGHKDIQTLISIMRTFANEWLGKPRMIGASVNYVKNPESVARRYVTNQDKSWSGQGIDVLAKLEEVRTRDERVALILELELAFGLRLKEALLLRPKLADKTSYLAVTRGTKGGRDRTVQIENDNQRRVLERAKEFSSPRTGGLIPDGKKFVLYRRRIYYICTKVGITRANGLVPHGLRHEYANEVYRRETGQDSPVKGGQPVDRETDLKARHEIAEDLGHSRPCIAGCYVGTWHPVALEGSLQPQIHSQDAREIPAKAVGDHTNDEKEIENY